MARIVINEQDLTTTSRAADNTDIAFVPGLMGTDRGSDGRFITHKGKYGVPTLCRTLADFEYYFGTNPSEFENDQIYNNIELFQNGDFDPGYIYAKELLSAGLQVVYIAMSSEIYMPITSAPSDFNINYSNYYVKGDFIPITDWSNVGPYVFKKSEDVYIGYLTNTIGKDNRNNDYYEFNPQGLNYNHIPIANNDITVSFESTNRFYIANKSGKLGMSEVFLKPNSVIGQTIYIPCNVTAVPDIDDINDISNKDNYTGIAYNNNILSYYKDGVDVTNTAKNSGVAGLHKDKSGNIYYLSATSGFIKNSAYNFSNEYLNSDETGIYPPSQSSAQYLVYADTNGIISINNPQGFKGYSTSQSSTGSMCLTYALNAGENTIQVSDADYIQYFGPIYQLIPAATGDMIYNQLYSLFNSKTNFETEVPPLTEKGEYSIKYITSGGYPNYRPKTSANINTIGLYSSMISLAEARGDAVALVDTPYEKDRTLNPLNSDSVYYQLQGEQIANGSFGSMVFEPKDTNLINTYIKSATGKALSTLIMPGSFSYLKSLASSLKQGNANWLAIAGVTRGLVPNLVSTTLNRLTNSIADYYQGTLPNGEAVEDFKYAINAITDIKPYGYCIWGNRTLASNADGQKATNYLNIRNAVSDIKKICYTSAKRLMFEQNDVILWTKFLSYITPTLDKMNSGSGISGYKVLKLTTNEHAKLACKIIIFPVYAVENFEITVELRDEEITVEE